MYNADPYEQTPTTGMTNRYDFVIERGSKNLEGVNESAIVINTQRPGPIEANWGDTMQLTVTNRITGPEEGGILYWHGLLQVGTPGFDGGPPVQHCPIAPGSTFTYTFKAGLYGTCWYDARYSAHNTEGSAGSRILYG